MRLLCFLLFLPLPAMGEVLTGTVRVVDADTFDIGAGANVRLLGIDAPEDGQPCRDDAGAHDCGAMATAAARAAFEGRAAVCEIVERDRYGRWLAACRVAGRDVGAELVAAGWAMRYRDDPAYEAEEKTARLLARGVWAYAMDPPHVWRAARRAERAERNAPDAGTCAIKGNRSDNGRLYHLPGMPSYGATRIDEARGERWFCTEADARAAGWRRAGS